MLSDGSWSLLRRCLAQGRNCLIQSDTEKGLNAQVQFLDEEEEQGHCEKEHGGKKEGKAEMMILTPQVELKERVEMDDLASYAKEIIKFLKFYLSQVTRLYSSLRISGLRENSIGWHRRPRTTIRDIFGGPFRFEDGFSPR